MDNHKEPRVTEQARRHELKTDPAVFAAVLAGAKTHEIRKNDRDFAVGDKLLLRETAHTGAEIAVGAPLSYTGREIERTVSHVLTGYGLQEGWCILSLARQAAPEAPTLTPHDADIERMLDADEAATQQAGAADFAHIERLSEATTRAYTPVYHVWDRKSEGWDEVSESEYLATDPSSRRVTHKPAATTASASAQQLEQDAGRWRAWCEFTAAQDEPARLAMEGVIGQVLDAGREPTKEDLDRAMDAAIATRRTA